MGDKWDYWRTLDSTVAPFVQLAHAQELLADYDALAAENARLREALRAEVIFAMNSTAHIITHRECALCDRTWAMGCPEQHKSGYLAAPKGAE